MNTAPVAEAGGPYAIDEGSTGTLDGTASSDPHNAVLTYSWSPATNLDDPTSPTPVYDATGLDDSVEELTLTVNDQGGDVSAAEALRWKHQYSGDGAPHIDDATAAGYLAVVNAVSSVFSEAVAAASAAEAHAVLSPAGGDKRAVARAALLVAWLQFASGAVAHDATVSLRAGPW